MEARKILLVEDDPNFGAILKDYLMLNDFDVTLAKNGMEGFEKFKREVFDLCILDVMMPYKDGYTLAREIREKNQEVPIIFLTAKTLKEDVLKGYKVGADDYLNKPFDLAELKLYIANFLWQLAQLKALYQVETGLSPAEPVQQPEHEQRFLQQLQQVLQQHFAQADLQPSHLAEALAECLA